MKPQWKWIGLFGAALLAFSMANVAQAQYGSYGSYGYGNYGYAQAYPSYGYPVPAYPSYSYPSYGGVSPYYNRTEQYHYTHPRVTTGYGFQSYPAYPVYPYYGGGSVNVRYPSGGVNVGYGRRGGGVQVYGGFGNINIGW